MHLPLDTRALLGHGLTRRALDAFVADGTLRRLRAGWFADAATDSEVAIAVQAGGTLTCASALAAHGGWQLADGSVHVRFPESRAARPWRSARTLARHGSRGRSLPSASATLLDDPLDAVRCASRCLSDEALVIVVDAARNRGLLGQAAFESLVASLPPREQVRLGRCVADSGSGSETRVRLFFEELGVAVTTQFEFGEREYLDLLVDGWLAIECDSIAHHAGPEQFVVDRRRTLDLQRDRYVVVRLTFDDVWCRWEQTTALLFDLVRRGPAALRRGAAATRRRLARRDRPAVSGGG